MENIIVILKKRLSSYRSEKGSLTRVSDDLLIDLLKAWESWTGSAKEFYSGLGVSKMQLGGLMSKAKKLRRERGDVSGDFKEIRLEGSSAETAAHGPCVGIELNWDQGKVIRFHQVEQLVDFLKKVA